MNKRILFFLFIITELICFPQKNDSSFVFFKEVEQELKIIEKGFLSRIESERIDANKKFIAAWDKIVDDANILNYPFDSIKEASILFPKDKKFKLITWNLNKDDGTHTYFGYLIVNNSKRIKKSFLNYKTIIEFEVFKLSDHSIDVKSPENHIGGPDKWFGMLYTQIIECDGFYTLIGWDGNSKLTKRKFIDVLYFKSDGEPVFGKDIFKIPKKSPKRLMFEYSSEVSMSLKYIERKKQIIYSHLASREDGAFLEGMFQFYGPDGSFDAIELKKDRWVSIEDVDVRTNQKEMDKRNKPNPKNQKSLFKPK